MEKQQGATLENTRTDETGTNQLVLYSVRFGRVGRR